MKPGFKDMSPVNDMIPLDKKKPDKYQFTLNKNANDKIKCKHCGQMGHKKETCWKLEAKSKRPEWWIDMAAVRVDDGKIIFMPIVQMRTLKLLYKLYCCI